MTPVVGLAAFLWSSLGRRVPAAADDPFGSGGQDPDAARDAACDLTVPDEVCFPPEPEPFIPPPTSGGSASSGGVALGNLLVVLLVAALVVCIVWIVVTILRNRGASRDEVDDEDLDVDLDAPVDQRMIDSERPPDTWRSAAADHRGAGRYRDAIRCEYRALVGDLARAGVVDEVPGRTSGEERVQLADLAPAVAADFDTSADLFDEAWFGDAEIGPRDDEEFVAASRSVLDVVLAGVGGVGRVGLGSR